MLNIVWLFFFTVFKCRNTRVRIYTHTLTVEVVVGLRRKVNNSYYYSHYDDYGYSLSYLLVVFRVNYHNSKVYLPISFGKASIQI